MQFNVLVSEVRAAMLFASNDESRFALNGVHFEVRVGKNPVLAATDGRRLAVIETRAMQPEESLSDTDITVASGFLKPLCAFAKSQAATLGIEYHPSKRVIFHLTESKCVVDSEGGAVIEAAYPNWRAILPSGDKQPVSQLGLNAEYIADFAKAAKLLGCDVALIRLNLFSEDSTIEIHIENRPHFYGIVMPLKAEEPTKNWQPEFLSMSATTPGPLDGTTVTITTAGMEPVTVSGEAFSRAAKTIKAKTAKLETK